MKRKHMMKKAHEIAKGIVHEVEDYQIALSLALKEIWRQVKLYDKKRFTDYSIFTAITRLITPKTTTKKNVEGVPAWLIEKNLTNEERYAVLNECEGASVKYETEKAVLMSFHTPYGEVEMWSPKSVLVA